MTRGHIAFIDDEPGLCAAAADWLEASEFSVETWTDPIRARGEIDPGRFDAVLTDLRMPGLSGDRLMADLRARDGDLPVILMSAHADVPVAVAAMREGAHHFIEKPYLAEYLVAVLDRAVEWRRLRRETAPMRSTQASSRGLEQQVPGRSALVRQLRDDITQIADAPVDVLLTGPPGSGSETIARLIHELSRRAKRQFVALDCAALSPETLEGELFGFDRGTRGNATGERHSRFEFAQGGTIFLAGIQALPMELQARLYRVLRDRAVIRMGGSLPRPADVRLIAASREELLPRARSGQFHADLYFRLSGAPLNLPGLAARPEDIGPVYLQYLADAARRLRRPLPEPTPGDLEALRQREWPGNLAQLRAHAERQVLGLREAAAVIEPTVAPPGTTLSLAAQIAGCEAQIISRALEQCGGSSAAAAMLLGLPRRTLNEKIARHGLRGETGRPR